MLCVQKSKEAVSREDGFWPLLKHFRRAAAYEACVRLHQKGELDNNLLPLGRQTLEKLLLLRT